MTLLLEDAVQDDVELGRGDGALGVGGAGGDDQGGRALHRGGDGLADTDLGAEVRVMVADGLHPPPHLPPHRAPHHLLVLAGVVHVDDGPVLAPGQLPEHEEAEHGHGQEEDHHGHGDDDDEEGRGGGLCWHGKNVQISAGRHEGEEIEMFILIISTGNLNITVITVTSLTRSSADLIEVSDSGPVEGVQGLGHPLTVCVSQALPLVVLESHQLELAGPPRGHGQVQSGQEVVVESEGGEGGEEGEHVPLHPLQTVVV